MMARELERALLQWVNTFQLDKEVSSWADFEDGQIFWQILTELDPEYFQGQLPESIEACKDNWIPKWKNVKHVHHTVLSYMNISNMLPHYSQHLAPDLKAVASEGSPEHTMQILKAIVYVALFSEKSNERQVHIFSTTGLTTFSAPIKKMIDGMRDAEDQLATAREANPDIDASNTGTPSRSLSNDRSAEAGRDKEEELLNMEAKWYETLSAKNDLQAAVAKLTEELKQSHRQTRNLEEQITESEQSFRRRFEEYRERERVQHLNDGDMSDKDIIAQLETELAEFKAQVESQERQINKLNVDSVSKQELRDKLQLLTFERDELQQKAKANENLKKKIQTLQEFERKYQGIADTLENSKTQLEDFEELKQKYEDLKRANQESLRTIQSCEQQIMVEAERNKILQHEKKHKEQELEQTKELVQRYIEMKEELEGRVRELESSEPGVPSRLEDELAMEESEFIETPRTAQPESSGAEVLILQQKLDLAEARAKRIEEQYLTAYEEKLGLQAALKDISAGNTAASNHPSVKLQDRLDSTEEELKDSKEQQFAASAENAALRDQLAKASVEGIGTELDAASTEDLVTLRANHEKLMKDHATLEKYNRDVANQLADQRSLLRRAMLRRVQGEDELANREDMLQRVKEQVSIPAHAPAAEKEDLIEEVSISLTAEIGKLKDFEAKAADYDTLKQELEHVRKEAGEQASEALMQELESQKRENDLMVSAWYSISSRLQSNVVALARKAEAPKSWMRRQQFGMGGGVTMTRR